MNRRLRWTACGLLVAASAAAQDNGRRPAFEVATIKPSAALDVAALRTGRLHIGTRIDSGRVDIGTISLLRLICSAYRLAPYQVKGPEWLKSTNFDIQAKIPDGGRADQIPEMLQTLLEERFGLKIHHDSKEEPVYALVVAKAGAKLKQSTTAGVTPPNDDSPKPENTISIPTVQGIVKLVRGPQGVSMEMPDGEITGKVNISVNPTQPPTFHLDIASTSMKIFAAMLSIGVVDRPVVDMTGLTGSYDVAVDISSEDARKVMTSATDFGIGRGGAGDGDGAKPAAAGVAGDPSGASIVSSIEKLGLRLESRKTPLDLVVVDRINKDPTPN
jgi:uncharacterized protein (TIGR03435 family)